MRLSPHIYNGIAGVAFLLSAAWRVTGESRFRESARTAILPLRRKMRGILEDPEKDSKVDLAVGGLIGLGSFVYALLRLGEWLEEPTLFEEAHAISTLMTEERITNHSRFRVQHGSAGAILALLALHRICPDALMAWDMPPPST